MKPKKINPGEEFIIHGTVYSYSLVNDKPVIKALRAATEKKSFIPPTIEEVKAFFKEKGYVESAAIKAFDYYSAGDWKDAKGEQVKNWKQKMIAVWMRDEFKIKEEPKQTGMVR